MGYDATWTPAAGGGEQTARVLFNKPTGKEKIDEWNFDPRQFLMEYKEGDFPGLFESVRNNEDEFVTINSVVYAVRDVRAFFDGKIYKALLTLA